MNPENLTVVEIVAGLRWTKERLAESVEKMHRMQDRQSAEFNSLAGYINNLEVEMQAWQAAFDTKIPKHPGRVEWEQRVLADAAKKREVCP